MTNSIIVYKLIIQLKRINEFGEVVTLKEVLKFHLHVFWLKTIRIGFFNADSISFWYLFIYLFILILLYWNHLTILVNNSLYFWKKIISTKYKFTIKSSLANKVEICLLVLVGHWFPARVIKSIYDGLHCLLIHVVEILAKWIILTWW